MEVKIKAYLTNGSVAWEIPEEIAYAYVNKYYLPPEGWLVQELGIFHSFEWKITPSGMLVKFENNKGDRE